MDNNTNNFDDINDLEESVNNRNTEIIEEENEFQISDDAKTLSEVENKKIDPAYTSLLSGGDGSGVISKSVEQVIHESMMPYSEYVILDRALPRVEDGLKPVQRRVLYSMLEVGVTPDKPYRKSATIVGTCMGRYHPHGDSSIYQTMVRLAQDFNMGMCLVDGHGNFGSVDGDGAAAMRYTEARLSPISLELLKDIEKNTVSWSFNFDDTRKEPDMLPGRFPNLLVNGAQGIAVGLATNIPTHNLGETIDVVCAYIDNNKLTLDEALKLMPGPDFSTGGYMLSSSDFKQVYETGRGKIVIRAKLSVESLENGRSCIVITEFPYQVNKASLLQRIEKLKESDSSSCLSAITDIVDESDRHGTRAVIKLKRDANVNAIINYLYNKTDLQVNFNANIVAIAEGKPKQLGLLEIVKYYVKYQKSVIYNRTKYDLDAALKREHILEGLLIAIKNIDDVIKIIKSSKSTADAKTRLMEKFYLSDVQAQAILDMRLARLTNLEVNKLVNELEQLKKLIAELKSILESDQKQLNLIKKELNEIKDKYSIPRRTEIIEEEQLDESLTMTAETGVVAEDVCVICSEANTLKYVNKKSYELSIKELGANPTLYEIPKLSLISNTNKNIYVFTNLGNCHRIKISQLPNSKAKDKGKPLTNFVKSVEVNEQIVGMFEFTELDKDKELIFVTKSGLIKITKLEEYISSKQSIAAIKLKADDEVVYVAIDKKDKTLVMFSHDGMAINIIKDDVAAVGRVSMGVKGMNLANGDYIVNATLATAIAYAIFTSNGYGKVIKQNEIPVSARARKGVKVINGKKLDIKTVGAYILDKNIKFVALSADGLKFVENKKLSLENKLGMGRSVLGNRTGGVTTKVTTYTINEF